MRLALNQRAVRVLRRLPVGSPYALAAAALIMLIGFQLARLLWVLAAPLGPVGEWRAPYGLRGVDPAILTRVDPFFRLQPAGGTVAVSSLPLKLFGVRLDQSGGGGSAIIAAADGVQNSYVVGDEIMPGVRLKAVAFDSVTIDRGAGAGEQIFLDQSVPARPVVATVAGSAPPPPVVPPVTFAARPSGGITVGAGGNGDVFRASGLQEGDVVTSINGVPVTSLGQAQAAASDAPASGIITYTVERGGKTLTFNTQGPTQ